MGGHLLHAMRAVYELVEKGGPLSGVLAVVGAIVAYVLMGEVVVKEPILGCIPTAFQSCATLVDQSATLEHVLGLLIGAVVGAGVGVAIRSA